MDKPDKGVSFASQHTSVPLSTLLPGKAAKAKGKQPATRKQEADERDHPKADRTKPKKTTARKNTKIVSEPRLAEGSEAPVAAHSSQKKKGRIKPIKANQKSSADRHDQVSTLVKEDNLLERQDAGMFQ